MDKTDMVFKCIGLTPSTEDRERIDNIVNGGKSDSVEKAYMVCALFDLDEQIHWEDIYDVLTGKLVV